MVAFLSCLVAEEFEKKTHINVISLPPYNRLDLPVSTHADMLLSVIDDNIFVYEEYYQQNIDLFLPVESKYKIITVKKQCKREYPDDIALNVLIIGKKIFCKIKNTADEILKYAKESGYEVINISQGYSACSTLVVDESTAITADKGVYNALLKANINVLLIANDNIKLEGYNQGLVGGIGGFFENTLYVFGEIKNLKDYTKIKSFLDERKIQVFEILAGDVCDFGGFKLLDA